MSVIRDYELNYVVHATMAVAALKTIQTELVALEAAAVSSRAAVANVASGMQSAGGAAAAGVPQVNALTDSMTGLGHSVSNVVPKFLLFEAGVKLVQTFGAAIDAAREHLKELGDEAAETRDKFRELANLKGETGPNDAVVAETMVMGMNAGMLPDEARKFMEQFEGSVPMGRQKGNITANLEKPVAQEAMKFGTRVALHPATAGDLAGVLAQYGKIDSVEQAAGQMGAIAHGLNEGRGNLEPLMRSLIKTAGALVEENGGPMDSLPELSAALGVASANATPDRAGTQLKNAVQGLRKFGEDVRGRTLKELDITPRDSYIEALNKIAPKVRAADEEGIGGDTWLRASGFKNEDEIRGILQQSRNVEAVNQRYAAAREKGQGQLVIEADEQFLANDKTGIHRRNQAEKAGQDFLTGRNNELLQEARLAGHNKLRDEGKLGGFNNLFINTVKNVPRVATGGAWKSTEQDQSEAEFMRMLYDEAQKVGINIGEEFEAQRPEAPDATANALRRAYGLPEDVMRKDDEFGNAPVFTDEMKPEERREAATGVFDAAGGKFVNRMIEQVIQKGGDPFRGSKAHTVDRLEKAGTESKDNDAERVVDVIARQGAAVGVDIRRKQAEREHAEDKYDQGDYRPDAKHILQGRDGQTIQKSMQEIRDKGGDPFGGSKLLEQKFNKLIEEAIRTNQILNGLPRGPLPAGGGAVGPGRK